MKKQIFLFVFFAGLAANSSYAHKSNSYAHKFQKTPGMICFSKACDILVGAGVSAESANRIMLIPFKPSHMASQFFGNPTRNDEILAFYLWDTPHQIAQLAVEALNIGIPVGISSYLVAKLGKKIYRKLCPLKKDDEPTERAASVEEPDSALTQNQGANLAGAEATVV